MADAPVLTTVDGPVGWLTLNRPEAMNAVTVELARELEAGLRRLAGEAAVIVIRGAGGSQRLPRLVGRQRAAAHILTGDRLSGAEARAWGLAYQAVPAAELDAATRALAGRLASRSPEALARTKRLLVRGLELPLADGLALERAEV